MVLANDKRMLVAVGGRCRTSCCTAAPGNCSVTARTVEGMARVRSGQVPAPHIDRRPGGTGLIKPGASSWQASRRLARRLSTPRPSALALGGGQAMPRESPGPFGPINIDDPNGLGLRPLRPLCPRPPGQPPNGRPVPPPLPPRASARPAVPATGSGLSSRTLIRTTAGCTVRVTVKPERAYSTALAANSAATIAASSARRRTRLQAASQHAGFVAVPFQVTGAAGS
jgi:hypothetical protein